MRRYCLLGLLVSVLLSNDLPVLAQENPVPSNIALDTLRDVKDPVNFPLNYILFVILIGVLLTVILFFVLKKLIQKKEIVGEIPVDTRTPWEIAYDEFKKLEQSQLLEEGQFKAFYSKLSGIIRQYFENHFNVRAPEMTTEEFLWSLEKKQELSEKQKSALKNFLTSCDIVKFAKHIPGVDEGRASFQFARDLVDQTKGTDEPASEPTNHKPSV